MDLSSAITAAGSGSLADLTTNLGAVAGIVIPIAVALLIFRRARGAIR